MKSYLGDGVYVEYDGYGFILTTENGLEITNTIVLEPSVFMALIEFTKLTINSDDSKNIET